MNNAIRSLFDKRTRFKALDARGFYRHLSDKNYLLRRFYAEFGYNLDLRNPQTYNEKLQWLKLYDRKPIYSTMVDKYEAKEYVSKIIGQEYIIPTLGVYDHFDEIDFSILPDQFVIKCTHDSGGLIICRDKKTINIPEAKKKITASLETNYYLKFREWPYKNVKPRIIIEQYMEEENNGSNKILNDYKIYTFNGKAKMCMINQDRGIHTRADYFDEDYNWLDFTWGYDHADIRPIKPNNYEQMFSLAEKLSVGTTELRVDFYQVNNKVYFGELTFFDGSGFDKITPVEWDRKLGSWIKL